MPSLSNRGFVLVGALLVVGVLAYQQSTIRSLRNELRAALAGSQRTTASGATESSAPQTTASKTSDRTTKTSLARLERRVDGIEAAIGDVTRSYDQMMDRGQVPLSDSGAERIKLRFLDRSQSDRDRIMALRVLQQNGRIDEAVVAGAVAWMQSSTNGATIEDVIRGLDGVTNSLLLSPLLRLATSSDARVRSAALVGLRPFGDEAAVQNLWWDAVKNNPDERTRDIAADLLGDRPVNESVAAELRGRAVDPNASFAERLTAFRSLSRSKTADAATTAAFADSVVDHGDAQELRILFRTLDNTGNLAAAPALVKGLQMQEPELRALAADALSEMQADPTVRQWLKFAAENDADPKVRAEAIRVIGQFKGD